VNQQEIKSAAANLLQQLERGPGKGLGTELFDAVALHSVSYAFEAVALRRRGEKLWVYLRKRAEGDTAYPGQWHCPGSVKRPYEKWQDVQDRLVRGEFKAHLSNRRRVGEIPTEEARGSFTSVVFLVDVDGDTDPAKWFPVGDLPEATVALHKDMVIPLAVAAFEVEEAQARLDKLKKQFCDE
jgi:hypothetical protein